MWARKKKILKSLRGNKRILPSVHGNQSLKSFRKDLPLSSPLARVRHHALFQLKAGKQTIEENLLLGSEMALFAGIERKSAEAGQSE